MVQQRHKTMSATRLLTETDLCWIVRWTEYGSRYGSISASYNPKMAWAYHLGALEALCMEGLRGFVCKVPVYIERRNTNNSPSVGQQKQFQGFRKPKFCIMTRKSSRREPPWYCIASANDTGQLIVVTGISSLISEPAGDMFAIEA